MCFSPFFIAFRLFVEIMSTQLSFCWSAVFIWTCATCTALHHWKTQSFLKTEEWWNYSSRRYKRRLKELTSEEERQSSWGSPVFIRCHKRSGLELVFTSSTRISLCDWSMSRVSFSTNHIQYWIQPRLPLRFPATDAGYLEGLGTLIGSLLYLVCFDWLLWLFGSSFVTLKWNAY